MSNLELAVNIDFANASTAWRANKYRLANSNSWRYYDKRHLGYRTPPISYPAHKPRCGYIIPGTNTKCHHTSYFTKTHKNELIVSGLINDVDYLDGLFCWQHKKYEATSQIQSSEITAELAKIRLTHH